MRITLLFILLIAVGCQKTPSAEQAAPEEPVEIPEAMGLATLQAQATLRRSHTAAFQTTSRWLERRVREDDRAGGDRPDGLDRVVTVVFGANNRGEREDCGCRSNPLGGLTRRHTLIELARQGGSEAAQQFWGEGLPESSTVFVVDAGDLFFRRPLVERARDKQKDLHWGYAQAVLEGVNFNPPDVFSVGHEDVVMGREKLELLAKDAKFPFLSANLHGEDGPLFEGHRIAERDGVRVAFIGLTGEDEAYFKERELSVKDGLEAYKSELAKIEGDLDLVILLSNLGMGRTGEVVKAIRAEGLAVSAAVVSSTGRHTRPVDWVDGVPLVEPEIRGKHFGRLDIYLDDQKRGAAELRYANGGDDVRQQVQSWRNAYLEYVQARQRHAEVLIELETIRLSPAPVEEEDVQQVAESHGADRETQMKRLENQAEIFERRVAVASESYVNRASELPNLDEASGVPAGSTAWLDARVIPVKLTIDEDPRVRAALDRRAPRAPAHKHSHNH